MPKSKPESKPESKHEPKSSDSAYDAYDSYDDSDDVSDVGMTAGKSTQPDDSKSKSLYVCDNPCGSVLVHYSDAKTNKLYRKCTSCSKKYDVGESEYVLSQKQYYQAGEENVSEAVDFNRVKDDITIETVFFKCPTCKDKTKAKFWRSDQTLAANNICLSCKQHFGAESTLS